MYLSVVVNARCPASSWMSRKDPPVFARTRAEVVMKVRLPECDEQPTRPSSWYAEANQFTTLCVLNPLLRSDRRTGPVVGPLCD